MQSVTESLRRFVVGIEKRSLKGGRSGAGPRRLPRLPVQALIVPLFTAVAALLLVGTTQMDPTGQPSRRATSKPLAQADTRDIHPEVVVIEVANRQAAALEEADDRATLDTDELDHDAIAVRTASHQATDYEETYAFSPLSPVAGLGTEIECLAQNIYFEARSESDQGKLAVGQVVMNRVASQRFPGAICDVVRQGGEAKRFRCQFSWWCDGKSDKPSHQKAWQKSMALARDIYWGRTDDPTDGALWYHADYVDPYWRSAFNEGPKIGRHIFYTAKTATKRTQLAGTNLR